MSAATIAVEDLKAYGRQIIPQHIAMKPDGRRLRGNCPFHKDRTPSFYVFEDGGGKCFGCGWQGDVFDFLRDREAMSFPEAKAYVLEAAGVLAKPATPQSERLADTARTTQALAIWRETVSLKGTLAETYLRRRGLDAEGLGHVLRFHPRCPFGQDRVPCMVALMRDSASDEPCGIHRTALGSDASKHDRKMLGPSAAVKLTPHERVSSVLGIAEGIETALSVLQAKKKPMWALLSAGGIERFNVIEDIETLAIWADNDANGVGARAAHATAARWANAGCKAYVITPALAGDFNDLTRGVTA